MAGWSKSDMARIRAPEGARGDDDLRRPHRQAHRPGRRVARHPDIGFDADGPSTLDEHAPDRRPRDHPRTAFHSGGEVHPDPRLLRPAWTAERTAPAVAAVAG